MNVRRILVSKFFICISLSLISACDSQEKSVIQDGRNVNTAHIKSVGLISDMSEINFSPALKRRYDYRYEDIAKSEGRIDAEFGISSIIFLPDQRGAYLMKSSDRDVVHGGNGYLTTLRARFYDEAKVDIDLLVGREGRITGVANAQALRADASHAARRMLATVDRDFSKQSEEFRKTIAQYLRSKSENVLVQSDDDLIAGSMLTLLLHDFKSNRDTSDTKTTVKKRSDGTVEVQVVSKSTDAAPPSEDNQGHGADARTPRVLTTTLRTQRQIIDQPSGIVREAMSEEIVLENGREVARNSVTLKLEN